MAETYKKGQYYCAKHRGNGGDLLVGRVKSVRTDGEVILINMLTGARSTKDAKVLSLRNKRIKKRQAEELVSIWERTKSKKKVREASLTMEVFDGYKKRSVKRTPIPPEVEYSDTPPDYERCQAEKAEDISFMTLGKSMLVRCKNVPKVLVVEREPGKDGKIGRMSLCEGCLKAFKDRLPRDYADIIPIAKKPKAADLVMLDKILNGNPLWDFKGLPSSQVKPMTRVRNKIKKEHKYLLDNESVDEYHAGVLLGSLNLIDGLLGAKGR